MPENILVTGFGPFGDHEINASWEAVKLLPSELEVCGHPFRLITELVEVCYQYVEEKVPQLWDKYKPKLVVHVGVSSIADKLTIEKCANNEGYVGRDCYGKNHSTGKVCCTNSAHECIFGDIDYTKISDHINSKFDIKATTSTNAGRYLCEFTYYTSLNIDKSRTMFIHVPPLGQPYSAQELCEGLIEIIKCAIQQVCTSL